MSVICIVGVNGIVGNWITLNDIQVNLYGSYHMSCNMYSYVSLPAAGQSISGRCVLFEYSLSNRLSLQTTESK